MASFHRADHTVAPSRRNVHRRRAHLAVLTAGAVLAFFDFACRRKAISGAPEREVVGAVLRRAVDVSAALKADQQAPDVWQNEMLSLCSQLDLQSVVATVDLDRLVGAAQPA